ncbi:hypothetical protein QR98_0093200 [Sarcoptes scabiei]|uniref:Uncharacterized protein n=1 Tax=Sarcoptes scabiei TaxID=52283 RepID=A0A132AIC4_SARSC|nr:hypothetical protein QR98_0093200 [Sarcoptes scabiei]
MVQDHPESKSIQAVLWYENMNQSHCPVKLMAIQSQSSSGIEIMNWFENPQIISI